MPCPKPTYPPCRFAEGDKVQWSSQAQGQEKTKFGTVVKIVKGGRRPTGLTRLANKYTLMFNVYSPNVRTADTAMVAVAPPAGSKAKPKLYWPLDSLLKAA